MCRLRSIALVVAVLLAGCRIEDRTPAGTRRDDDAIRSVLATYYQSLGQRDWSTSRALFWDSATVEVRRAAPDSAWRDFRTADAYHQYLARTYAGDRSSAIAVRMFRLDIRQQGDLASAWVVTRRRPLPGEGRDEVGTADNFVLRRRGGAWRIVSYASTPDIPAVPR
jgi:hypothetical protein